VHAGRAGQEDGAEDGERGAFQGDPFVDSFMKFSRPGVLSAVKPG
jgi:hypothetical protein